MCFLPNERMALAPPGKPAASRMRIKVICLLLWAFSQSREHFEHGTREKEPPRCRGRAPQAGAAVSLAPALRRGIQPEPELGALLAIYGAIISPSLHPRKPAWGGQAILGVALTG